MGHPWAISAFKVFNIKVFKVEARLANTGERTEVR
jgi:hypothetical protein